MTRIVHPFQPLFDKESRILILGSFLSVKSRESNFYYGNKNNRFWQFIARVLNHPFVESINEKKEMLLNSQIALWDVIESCKIIGSSDSSIREVRVNDINYLITNSQISKIACNGNKAFQLYNKYVYTKTAIKAVRLPSTSSANATWSLDKLVEEYKKIIILE